MKSKLFLLIIFMLLGACSLPTKYERNPSTPGYGRDSVKQSRCACMLIYDNGVWLG